MRDHENYNGMQKFTIAKVVGPKDWAALPRRFKVGETIYRFTGHDFGCAREDMMFAKRETISCSLEIGLPPFFTVPVEFIRTESGDQPHGSYARVA